MLMQQQLVAQQLDNCATSSSGLKRLEKFMGFETLDEDYIKMIREEMFRRYQNGEVGLKLYLSTVTRLLECNKRFIRLTCPKGHGYTAVPIGCNLPVCPICSKKRHRRFHNKYIHDIETWSNAFHVIITLKNMPHIYNKNFKELSEFWKLLRQKIERYCDKHNLHYPFIRGIRVYEVTEKGRGYHLHMHILYEGFEVNKYILSKMWKDITKTSYIVKVKPVNSTVEAKKCMNYLGAYLSKGISMDSGKKIVDMYLAMRNVKLVSTFGKKRKDISKKVKHSCHCPKCERELVFDKNEDLISLKDIKFDNLFKPIYVIKVTVSKKDKQQQLMIDRKEEVLLMIKAGYDKYEELAERFSTEFIDKMLFEGYFYKLPDNRISY